MEDSGDSRNPGQKYREYHPYQNLQVPKNQYFYVPTEPEHLFIEEAVMKHRTWAENLQFYTGSAYLSGAVIGGGRGTFQGLKDAEAGESLKLRVNRVLNSGGQTGRKFGNQMGILGLMFGGFESAIMYYADTDDVWTTVAAGLSTGAIYKAASGPKGAAVAGAIGGLAAAAAVAGKQVILPAIRRYVPSIPI